MCFNIAKDLTSRWVIKKKYPPRCLHQISRDFRIWSDSPLWEGCVDSARGKGKGNKTKCLVRIELTK